MERSESPARPGELIFTSKPRSPSSVQSSPFSSTISDNELDGSFLSRPSSSCSLNQQNSSLLASNQSKLFTSSSVVNPEKIAFSNGKIFDKVGSIRTRSLVGDADSDDDTMDDDSNCSSNDISSSSAVINFAVNKRSNSVIWRSPHDSVFDGGRKLSLASNTLQRTTPSPSTSGRSSPVPRVVCAAAPRSRIASIRRESNCSVETEAAHEKLVKTAQQVSATFDDISIADGERKRTHSLSEPISILTNAFLPHSCSPSPTRSTEMQKQCYSPSTQQIVRNNITYSPSPSPTPSPTRRIMRSLSPIVSRQITKRRYTCSSGMDSDSESFSSNWNVPKRICQPPVLSNNGSISNLGNEKGATFSFPSAEPSSTSSLEGFSASFCTPRPPSKASSESLPEKQKANPGISSVDSDECSSTTGGEELFISESYVSDHSLSISKSNTVSESNRNLLSEVISDSMVSNTQNNDNPL